MKEYVLRPGGPSLKIDYARELNPQQLAVAMAGDGPLLVIAGAGSGKTRTLTYRVARLVESGIPPSAILLLTFTNKAAREMLARVEGLLGIPPHTITGGTFHHVGNLVLRKWAGLVDLKPNFTILDRDDAGDLMKDVVAKLDIDSLSFPKADVLIDVHSYSVNTGTALPQVIAKKHPALQQEAGRMIQAINAYTHRKQKTNAVDFDDLLVFWRKILRNDDARQAQSARWRYLLVDEYQDTNRLQGEICEAIAGENGNIMVVGDDAQSIYSWRGAHFANIHEFPKRFPTAKQFKLEINYRSTPQILALTNDAIAHNAKQFRKTLQAKRTDMAKPEVVVTGSVSEQAQFVAQKIQDLVHEEGVPIGQIAVLYRAHWHSMELQMELTQRNIPFVVRSGLRFFEQAHIKDVCAFLRLVVNPRDEMAWRRAVKLYPRIGEKAASKIWDAIDADPDPLNAVLRDAVVKAVPPAARKGWQEFSKLVLALDKLKETPAQMVQAVLDGGYSRYLELNYPEFSTREEDVRRLGDFALKFRSAEEMLAELALTITVAGRDVMTEELEGVVVLSTVHQAKGLEWNSVFVMWLADGKFPDQRAVNEAGESGGEEEERRLFYVACTRAKDHLMLVYPVIANERQFRGVFQKPSRFIDELDKSLYEEVKVGWTTEPPDPGPRSGYRREIDAFDESESWDEFKDDS